jgi:hypothetical protein
MPVAPSPVLNCEAAGRVRTPEGEPGERVPQIGEIPSIAPRSAHFALPPPVPRQVERPSPEPSPLRARCVLSWGVLAATVALVVHGEACANHRVTKVDRTDVASTDRTIEAASEPHTAWAGMSNELGERYARELTARGDMAGPVVATLVELGSVDTPQAPALAIDGERVAIVHVHDGGRVRGQCMPGAGRAENEYGHADPAKMSDERAALAPCMRSASGGTDDAYGARVAPPRRDQATTTLAKLADGITGPILS